jgi:hypothetical protein
VTKQSKVAHEAKAARSASLVSCSRCSTATAGIGGDALGHTLQVPPVGGQGVGRRLLAPSWNSQPSTSLDGLVCDSLSPVSTSIA